MAAPGRKNKKVRVDFRQNRGQRRRSDDWTKRYHEDTEKLADTLSGESVRPKGDLSRKRTIRVDVDDSPIIDQSLWRPGVVTLIHGQICRVEDERGRRWDCTVRRVLRTLLIEQRSSVTVGDRVWFGESATTESIADAGVGVIERVEHRKTLLSRGARIGHDKQRGGHRRQHLIAANVDQLVIVASAAQPAFKPHLVDRYLVAAGKGDLRPVLCVNKSDLIPTGPYAPEFDADEDGDHREDDTAGHTFEEVLDEFRALGYCVIETSATRGDGIDALRAELKDRTSVFSGQSGVGKSSLLNAIQPGLGLVVGEVSDENEKGRHTTTHARLIRLEFGGYVVDTPGIRSFDLWEIEPGELEGLFSEFVPLIPQCRFNDCHHLDEEGCAVVEAMEEGRISPRRYFSYVKMLQEIRR